jgi:Skp family chaperone for outer membrane proteins
MNPNYKLIDMMGLISLQGDYSDRIAIHNVKTIIENKDSNKEMKRRYEWLKKNHPELII